MKRRMLVKQRGAAVIELAAVLGLMLTLFLGVVELARATQQFAALSASARAAARLASASPTAEGIARARCLAVYGRALESCSTGSAGTPIVPGLTLGHVEIGVPRDILDDAGTLQWPAKPGLATVQARTSDGSAAGTLDLLTVTIGPPGARVRFVPVLPGITPAFDLSPISVTMSVPGG